MGRRVSSFEFEVSSRGARGIFFVNAGRTELWFSVFQGVKAGRRFLFLRLSLIQLELG